MAYSLDHAAYSRGCTSKNGAPYFVESETARIRFALAGVHAMAIFIPSSLMALRRAATTCTCSLFKSGKPSSSTYGVGRGESEFERSSSSPTNPGASQLDASRSTTSPVEGISRSVPAHCINIDVLPNPFGALKNTIPAPSIAESSARTCSPRTTKWSPRSTGLQSPTWLATDRTIARALVISSIPSPNHLACTLTR